MLRKLKSNIHLAAVQTARSIRQPLCQSIVSLEKPVFVWGNGQSGTFLLFDILALSGEFSFHGTAGERKKGFATQKYGSHSISLPRKPVEGLGYFWSDVGLPWENAGEFRYEHPLTRDDADSLQIERVRSRYRQLEMVWKWKRNRKKRILDKATNYILMLDVLNVVFPDALHIFCIRDPRMVLSSIVRRFKDPEYEEGWRGYPSGFYSNIMLPGWKEYVDKSVEERHAWQIECCLSIGVRQARQLGRRCLIVHYEHLCNQTAAAIERISAFTNAHYKNETVSMIVQSICRAREYRWPTGVSNKGDADELFIDPSIVAGLTKFEQFSVELGYSEKYAGRFVGGALK